MCRKLGIVTVLVLILAACGGAPPSTADVTGPEVREVSMRLQWVPQYQFAGYIVAKAKGYYDEAGLDVTLNPGGPDFVPLPLVATGSDTFGSTGADTVLISRQKEIEVVALATWFQASPVAFMVHSDSGIAGPQDFPGHTVGMSYGDNVETEYRALLAATGVDRSQIKEIPGDFSLVPFLTRQVDVWPVYLTDQPNTARRQGANVDLIVARDYGVNLMGDVLFTTADFARENPRTVQAFVDATLRGWDYAVNNIDETVALLADYNQELSVEQLRFEANATVPLLRARAGERCLGWNDRTAWQTEADLLRNLDILASPADIDEALVSRFVAQHYAAQGVQCDE